MRGPATQIILRGTEEPCRPWTRRTLKQEDWTALVAALPAQPALALIATSPCGTRRRDWPHGLDEALLAGLATRLGRDWRATMQEFVSLEVRGEENPLATLRELKQRLYEHGAPSTAALAAGLELLRGADLRPELPRVRARTLVIGGEYDRLAPPAAVAALAALVPGARLESIARAAHAPFLSHRERVESLLVDFLAAP